MSDSTDKRKLKPFFLVKILVALIFPLEMVISPSHIEWTSILLVINSYHFPTLTSFPSLLIGLIILFPCIYFERMLNSSPISRSVRTQAVASCILGWGISMLLLLTGVIRPVSPYFELQSRGLFLYDTVIYAPILGISFFVVLPLILRESVLRTIPINHHQLDYRFINSTLRRRFKREKVLSGLLWFSLLFCPFLVGLFNGGSLVQFLSLSVFFVMSFQSYLVFADSIFIGGSLQLTGVPVNVLPITILLSSIRFVFVRDVFRFQRGIINKSRLASAAILGEILPSAIFALLMLGTISPSSLVPLILPAPILPIIGFMLIKLSRTPYLKEDLWPDYEYRMWFEKKQEPYTQEPNDESIKVPLTYLLVSQIRRFRNKER